MVKRDFFKAMLVFLCGACLLLNTPIEAFAKSYAITFSNIYSACWKDNFDYGYGCLSPDQSVENCDNVFNSMSPLFMSFDLIQKPFSPKQARKDYEKGLKLMQAKKYGSADSSQVHAALAIGAGLEYDFITEACQKISQVRLLTEGIGSYDTVFEYKPYTAFLEATKGATVEHYNNENYIANWREGNAVVFMVYVNETGNYEVEIEYSKNAQESTSLPLLVLASEDLSNKAHNTPKISAVVPNTGNNWKTYKKFTLGKLRLEVGKQYILMLMNAKKEEHNRKVTMNLRTLRLKKK